MTSKLALVLKVLFSLAFVLIAALKLTQNPTVIEGLVRMQLPPYLATILGIAYIAGVVAIWQTALDRAVEWGYAGFLIALIGGIAAHVLSGDPLTEAIPATILTVLLGAAYYFNRVRSIETALV